MGKNYNPWEEEELKREADQIWECIIFWVSSISLTIFFGCVSIIIPIAFWGLTFFLLWLDYRIRSPKNEIPKSNKKSGS